MEKIRGGKRNGAGRKPNAIKKIQITFRVLPQYKELIQQTFKQILIETEKFQHNEK
jgi:hypothetical protein